MNRNKLSCYNNPFIGEIIHAHKVKALEAEERDVSDKGSSCKKKKFRTAKNPKSWSAALCVGQITVKQVKETDFI